MFSTGLPCSTCGHCAVSNGCIQSLGYPCVDKRWPILDTAFCACQERRWTFLHPASESRIPLHRGVCMLCGITKACHRGGTVVSLSSIFCPRIISSLHKWAKFVNNPNTADRCSMFLFGSNRLRCIAQLDERSAFQSTDMLSPHRHGSHFRRVTRHQHFDNPRVQQSTDKEPQYAMHSPSYSYTFHQSLHSISKTIGSLHPT